MDAQSTIWLNEGETEKKREREECFYVQLFIIYLFAFDHYYINLSCLRWSICASNGLRWVQNCGWTIYVLAHIPPLCQTLKVIFSPTITTTSSSGCVPWAAASTYYCSIRQLLIALFNIYKHKKRVIWGKTKVSGFYIKIINN